MEVMLHFIYVVAISKSKAWDGLTPFELSLVGFFNLEYIWLKVSDAKYQELILKIGW